MSLVAVPGTSTSTGWPVFVEIQFPNLTRTASLTSVLLARTQSVARSSSITAAGPSGVSKRIVVVPCDSTTIRSEPAPRWGDWRDRACAATRPESGATFLVVAGPSKSSTTSPPGAVPAAQGMIRPAIAVATRPAQPVRPAGDRDRGGDEVLGSMRISSGAEIRKEPSTAAFTRGGPGRESPTARPAGAGAGAEARGDFSGG